MGNETRNPFSLSIDHIADSIAKHIDDTTRPTVLGKEVFDLYGGGTGRTLVKICLLADCLRISTDALYADRVISPEQLRLIFPFLRESAALLPRYRSEYRPFQNLTIERAERFLDHFMMDSQPFGYASDETRWAGLEICCNVAHSFCELTPLDQFEKLAIVLTQQLVATDGINLAERMQLEQIKKVIEGARARALTPDANDVSAPTVKSPLTLKQNSHQAQPLIGVTDPVCPYCAHSLEKMPGRKKRCPACGNDIFVRTRPQDKVKILVRSDQLSAARTKTSRALAKQQLDAIASSGIEGIGLAVEWSTAGFDVCALCQPLQGIVVTTREARGMIPRCGCCRCCWTPANVGEDKSQQKRSQASIQQAIDVSIAAEIPNNSNRTLAEQKQLSSWRGAQKTIERKRPKSLF